MPTHPLSRERAVETVSLVQQCLNEGFVLQGRPSAVVEAARRKIENGRPVNRKTFQSRLDSALRLYPDLKLSVPALTLELVKREPPPGLEEAVRKTLLHGSKTVSELSQKTRADVGDVLDTLDRLAAAGTNIKRFGDRYEIPKQHTPAYLDDGLGFEFQSDENNLFRFGAVGDNHCASKYERRDVLEDLYDRFVVKGVTHVFHTGNWIDGECRFNKHDLVAHGVDGQCRLLAETYPRRDGITTYAVWGDDHEGWMAQREGIDVGRYCESLFKLAGRDDWVNLGFMEALIRLVNANTGQQSMMGVVHPGMGASYALSYAVQKIIESLEGGEKPAVSLFGHFHKMWAGNIRNVWCAITGCAQDQTPFMRKKRIEAQVGGLYIEMEQHPESGAIIGFSPTMIRYFNKGFYNERWSHHGDVTLPERSITGR